MLVGKCYKVVSENVYSGFNLCRLDVVGARRQAPNPRLCAALLSLLPLQVHEFIECPGSQGCASSRVNDSPPNASVGCLGDSQMGHRRPFLWSLMSDCESEVVGLLAHTTNGPLSWPMNELCHANHLRVLERWRKCSPHLPLTARKVEA